jgi:hypothetical protein
LVGISEETSIKIDCLFLMELELNNLLLSLASSVPRHSAILF